MKKSLLSIFISCLFFCAFGQQVTWVSTTRAEHWASPWSPPTWMKTNGKYAAGMVESHEVIAQYKTSGVLMTGMDFSHVQNELEPGETGREGMDLFIQKDQYFAAYAGCRFI